MGPAVPGPDMSGQTDSQITITLCVYACHPLKPSRPGPWKCAHGMHSTTQVRATQDELDESSQVSIRRTTNTSELP